MMIALGWLVGVLLSGAIIRDAFEVMLVPRRVKRTMAVLRDTIIFGDGACGRESRA